jgi:hypothetical protein
MTLNTSLSLGSGKIAYDEVTKTELCTSGFWLAVSLLRAWLASVRLTLAVSRFSA